MIKRISNGEYLKRYGNMEAGEKALYVKRVGEWMNTSAGRLMELVENFDARLQNVATVSAMWNDAECKAFEDGVRLMSALTGTEETWLPELLYAKAARRSVKQLVKVLGGVGGVATEGAAVVQQQTKQTRTKQTVAVKTQAGQAGAAKEQPGEAVPATTQAGEAGAVQAHTQAGAVQGVPVRPKHIDQYVHLLPKSTQEKAAKVKDLLTELDYAREKARLLMDAPQASGSDRAVWASKASKIDAQVGAIYRELDREWEKLVKQGRVGVDDLGNAYVVSAGSALPEGEGASDGEPSGTAAELTGEQRARRRELRKFLVDTRRGNGKTREEHLQKWREAWSEYLTLESREAALGDEKILEAAKHYGITTEEQNTKHIEA